MIHGGLTEYGVMFGHICSRTHSEPDDFYALVKYLSKRNVPNIQLAFDAVNIRGSQSLLGVCWEYVRPEKKIKWKIT